MPLIGSHATVTGGVATGGLAYAAKVGAEVIQVFVSNPTSLRLRNSGRPAS